MPHTTFLAVDHINFAAIESNIIEAATLSIMEELIHYRLRMREVIPTEMSTYRIGKLCLFSVRIQSDCKYPFSEDGRVFFTVLTLFETSISLRGSQKDDGWPGKNGVQQ